MKNLIEITRNPNNADYHVEVKVKEMWELYRIERETDFLLQTDDKPQMFTVSNLENKRIIFCLKTQNKSFIVAESHIALQGAFNLRDLGGFRTKENRVLQVGKLFRCDDLATITSLDQDYLETLKLSTIVDFRSQEEINRANDKSLDGVRYKQLSISPGKISANTERDVMKMTKQEADCYMCDVYRLLVSDDSNRQYKEFFSILQDKNENATLYHCSAGKDRTGIATFFILYALGVDMPTIKKDYLSSNVYLKKKYEKHVQAYPQLEAMFTVKDEFIDIAIGEIQRKYQTIDNYLKNTLNIDFDLMKNKYLY